MTRIVKAPEVRRLELIEIAQKQFLENGYEKTSVRSILKEAGGEIGMFYHYFNSKKEIYEAVLAHYNEQYVEKIAQILRDSSTSFEEKLEQILSQLLGTISEYQLMCMEQVNIEIVTILHARTLQYIVPLFERAIMDEVEKTKIDTPVQNIHLFSQFLLYGISAVIHDTEVHSMEEKNDHIKTLLSKLMDTKSKST
jgi:AcrR family transcriptional regulator